MSGQPADFSLHGPVSGRARDFAIFFGGGDLGDPAARNKELEAHLGQCISLRQWAAHRGALLTESPSGIDVLEGLLATTGSTGPVPWRLRVETGLFIGTVLVRDLPGARWRLLPNGHPVIHLGEDSDLDVVALARARFETGAPDLRTVLPYARALAGGD